MRTRIKDILKSEQTDYKVNVKGWVRSFRNNQFIALNDGSCMGNLQVVIDLNSGDELLKSINNGASISVDGTVIPSLGKGQKYEVKADKVTVLGECDPEKFPLQLKNKPSLEYLREIAHLRFRTNTFGAIFRVRHSLAYAIHKFFNDRGFVYMHTPIITASDAEGAGEMFRVTTLDIHHPPYKSPTLDFIAAKYYDKVINIIKSAEKEYLIGKINSLLSKIEVNLTFKDFILCHENKLKQFAQKRKTFSQLNKFFEEIYQLLLDRDFFEKDAKSKKVFFPEWFVYHVLNITVEDANESRKRIAIKRKLARETFPYLAFSFYNYDFTLKRLESEGDKYIDFKEDFFGKSTNLTVSGQLEAELGAMAFSEVYTFGPTFRAENSNTARHLAEFWMIEPEVAFNDITDNMDLAEDLLKYIISHALEHNREDLEFLAQRLLDEEKQKPVNERSELGLIEKLDMVLSNKFERITYTEAIDILLASPHYKKKKFQYDVSWGIDMQSEHERYLVEKHFKKPVIVTGYPKEIKAFYMRQNDDGKTVAAMDILAPGIGEIVGGSQREERLDKLTQRMEEMHIPADELYWYLDTRRFGTVPHAGFGLGFERIVLFVTGMTNIRDVIPFPRTPKNAEF